MCQTTNIEILSWDSNFFGYLTARYVFTQAGDVAALLPCILDEAKARRVRLLYVYTPARADIVETIETAGGIWADHKVYLCRPLEEKVIADCTHEVKAYTLPYPTAGLEALALLSGAHSRFRLDAGFRHQEFERLYRHWIARCLRSEDTHVWIHGDEWQPSALLALRLAPPTAYIELIAVSSLERGKGIGSQLMQQAARAAQEAGCRFLRLNTQYHNQQAMLFYKKEGFHIEGENYIFHFRFTE